jgi:hypothetical protein
MGSSLRGGHAGELHPGLGVLEPEPPVEPERRAVRLGDDQADLAESQPHGATGARSTTDRSASKPAAIQAASSSRGIRVVDADRDEVEAGERVAVPLRPRARVARLLAGVGEEEVGPSEGRVRGGGDDPVSVRLLDLAALGPARDEVGGEGERRGRQGSRPGAIDFSRS